MPTASAPPEPPDLPSRIREHAARHPDAPALTFVDHADDPRGSATDWTYAEVDGHARRIAGLLGAHCRPGDTAAVLCPQGLYYAAAFLGCLYAGVRAVPLYPPQPFQRNGRLRALLGGAAPACVLTTPEHTAPIAELAAEDLGGNLPIVIDATGEAPGRGAATPCSPAPGDTAYLQYTSGSTGLPRGVSVTHANLAHTVEQSIRAYRLGPGSVSVSWLPLFHDFGLAASVTVPLAIGCRAVVFDPLAFVQHPLRWLRLLSRYGGTFAPCPDFALGMVCDAADAAATGAVGGSAGPGGFDGIDGFDGLDGLDLSALTSLVNGSEPVRKSSLDRFTDTFAPFGFAHEAHTPAYGLAEATILVSATPPGAAPRVFACDRRELAKGQAVPSAAPDDGTARMIVECGTEWGQEFAIVDPATLVGLPPRHVGEIWVRGPAVTAGYHGSPEQTARTYGRRRADAAPGDDREWLRTGDLGFTDEGHLFVVGRISDLVIIDGCNHHPADLESCVAAAAGADSGLRQGHLAAVSVDDGGRERLVVIAERVEGGGRDEPAEGIGPDAPAANAARDTAAEHRLLLTRARAAVAEQHGITLHGLVLVAAGTLPKTSSGKLRRATCRDRYLAGDYT